MQTNICIYVCFFAYIKNPRNPTMPYEAKVIITPLTKTPRAIATKESLFGRPNSAATREPVHAPVPGSGSRTNRKRPQNALRCILSLVPELSGEVSESEKVVSSDAVSVPIFLLFFIAFFLTHFTMGLKILNRSIKFKIWGISSKINGTGNRFPIAAMA